MDNKITAQQGQQWLEQMKERDGLSVDGINTDAINDLGSLLYSESLNTIDSDTLVMIKMDSGNALAIFGANNTGFKADQVIDDEIRISICRLSHDNAVILREVLPFTSPSALSGNDVTFGLGDRLGIASPGHIRLFKGKNACPVLAQQSVRELDLTARNYEDVMDSASWAVFQEGYKKPWGADGDHLKTEDWVKKALKIGFTMITADVSDYIKNEFNDMPDEQVKEQYQSLNPSYRRRIEDTYLNTSLELDTGETITFKKTDLQKIALIYNEAIEHALRLYQAGIETGKSFDFEFSIDETETPTLPQAHVFAAAEAINAGIEISSLAPRFIGEFQKGIDYIGDIAEFEKQFKTHAAIARHYGYRISVHSGSDKFSVFPIIGKHTNTKFHVKTAGTNWLEAVGVIAKENPSFFRKLYAYALEVFPIAKQYYHITPNMNNIPNLDSLSDDQLPSIFQNDDARQVIHVTYGEILRNPEYKTQIYSVLNKNIEKYWQALINHIGRHLETLGVK